MNILTNLRTNMAIFHMHMRRTYITDQFYIRNNHYPICKMCVYYKYPNKCTKFGKIDLESGLTIYDTAKECRQNRRKCGKKGREYHGPTF